VIAGAGDIACDPTSVFFDGGAGTRSACREWYVPNELLDMDLNRVLALGDNQYSTGTLDEFRSVYQPTWGALKSITAPAVGNHEYRPPGAAGYFDYFDGSAGRRGVRAIATRATTATTSATAGT
jgi:hypothetical protein